MTVTVPNPSDASEESRLRQLAALDWGNVPVSMILEEFGVTYPTLYAWRRKDAYKQQIEELRQAQREQFAALPSTAAIRKKIEHGMALSVDQLVQILAGGAQNKDKIAAARLMAQLDGRFLHGVEDESSKPSEQVESLASELLAAVRKQERVQ